MTKEEFQSLVQEGIPLFNKIITDLNKISKEYIHPADGEFWCKECGAETYYETYRRLEDFQEICVALALYEKLRLPRDGGEK